MISIYSICLDLLLGSETCIFNLLPCVNTSETPKSFFGISGELHSELRKILISKYEKAGPGKESSVDNIPADQNCDDDKYYFLIEICGDKQRIEVSAGEISSETEEEVKDKVMQVFNDNLDPKMQKAVEHKYEWSTKTGNNEMNIYEMEMYLTEILKGDNVKLPTRYYNYCGFE